MIYFITAFFTALCFTFFTYVTLCCSAILLPWFLGTCKLGSARQLLWILNKKCLWTICRLTLDRKSFSVTLLWSFLNLKETMYPLEIKHVCAVSFEFGEWFEFWAIINDKLTWGISFLAPCKISCPCFIYSTNNKFKILNLLSLVTFSYISVIGWSSYKSPRN